MCARLALLLALSFTPRLATAREPGLRFEWGALPGCPAREDVVSRAERLLGRSLVANVPGDLQLEAHVTRAADDAWRLDLLQRSSTGSQARSVTATSCDELGDAAALLLALSVDPSLAAGASASASASAAFPSEPPPAAGDAEVVAPESDPAQPSVGGAGEPRPTEPAAALTPDPPTHLHLGLAVGLSSGRLPDNSPAGLLHVGISRGAWLGLAELSVVPEQRTNVAGSTAGGELGLFGLSTGAGYMLAFAPMEFGPVAGVELGWLRGLGTGIDNPERANALLLSVHAGARYAVALSSHWALLAAGGASVLANRPRFVLDGIGPVYQPDRWGWRIGVGAEWRSR